MTDATPALLAYLSRWLDESPDDRDAEAVLWGRVAKVSEEAGGSIAALVGVTEQNPRPSLLVGARHSYDDADGLLGATIAAMTPAAVAERAGAPI